jgi:hypothetical protein
MSERRSVFDLFHAGIVAGMILAGVALEAGDAMFPDTFHKVFPRETLLLLAFAILAASIIGFVSLFLPSSAEEKPQKHLPTGGRDVQ